MRSAVAYSIVLRVISANRGVGATSTTGTTIDGIRSTCARISIAASRRCPGNGLRRVAEWLALVTAHTTTASADAATRSPTSSCSKPASSRRR